MDITTILALIGLLATGYGLLLTLIQFVAPRWEQRKSQAILQKELSRGAFDEATINQATLFYIRPKCSNLDPTAEAELRQAPITATIDLFSTVDKFLNDDRDTRRHLLILADSGTGKTSFVLNYYAYNASRRNAPNLLLVPLGYKNADKLIKDHPNQNNTVIFLDAFDEDTKAIEDHRQRIRDLLAACQHYRKVILTCRTQFFPKDEEIPRETGIVRVGPRRAGESGVYEFWKLYLAPFDDDEVKQYLKKRYPLWSYRTRRKAQDIAAKIPLLTARPMLLAHIPDLLETGSHITSTYTLYQAMVEGWLERESRWVDKEALREFSERLAVDIYLNREKRQTERVPKSELEVLAIEWDINLEDWQISGRSLLNRDAEGNYKFSHRSIMEFLFVKRWISGDQASRKSSLTDQMKKFLREANLSGANLSRANLSETNLIGADLHGTDLRGANLREAKIGDRTQIDGRWRLVWEIVNQGAARRDLSWTDLSGADLIGANLSEADLSGANLREADLIGANLIGADLSEADLSGAKYNNDTTWPDGFNPE